MQICYKDGVNECGWYLGVNSSLNFTLWAPPLLHPGPSPSEYLEVSILLLSKLLLKVSSDCSHTDGSQLTNKMQSQPLDIHSRVENGLGEVVRG